MSIATDSPAISLDEHRDLPEHQHNVRTVFDHSWQLLTPHPCSLPRQSAVFPNSIAGEEAAAPAGASLGNLAEPADRF